MPKYTLVVDAKTPTLTLIADIVANTHELPLPEPIYDDLSVRPTAPQLVKLAAGDYLMAFHVQNGSGEFTVALKDAAGVMIASHSFVAPPQVGRRWYFTIS